MASWNDTATRQAIESYVEAATGDRVAVFDNDGTLWCEKPMPIQLDFTLRHWAAMADHDPSLRARQPFKAAYEQDFGYQPMVELLRYLEANGFATFIASGGDRDFMRPIAATLYEIPAERVIGSSFALTYCEDEEGGAIVYKAGIDFFDDGPEKPVRTPSASSTTRGARSRRSPRARPRSA